MNDNKTYPKWVGIILGIILSGSSHFLSGKRSTGIKYHLGILTCGFLAIASAASPGRTTYALGAVFLLASLVLWLVMVQQSFRPVRRIGFRGWATLILITLTLNFFEGEIVRFSFQTFTIPTEGMKPTFIKGDCIFVNKLTYLFSTPQRGDIVVFKTDGLVGARQGTVYIKRIAGLPDETIRIAPPCLIVDDQKIAEPEIFNVMQSQTDGYPGFVLAHPNAPNAKLSTTNDFVVLKEDEFWVAGDNSPNSLDSRYYGPVPRSNIIGKVTRIYFPFARLNKLK